MLALRFLAEQPLPHHRKNLSNPVISACSSLSTGLYKSRRNVSTKKYSVDWRRIEINNVIRLKRRHETAYPRPMPLNLVLQEFVGLHVASREGKDI